MTEPGSTSSPVAPSAEQEEWLRKYEVLKLEYVEATLDAPSQADRRERALDAHVYSALASSPVLREGERERQVPCVPEHAFDMLPAEAWQDGYRAASPVLREGERERIARELEAQLERMRMLAPPLPHSLTGHTRDVQAAKFAGYEQAIIDLRERAALRTEGDGRDEHRVRQHVGPVPPMRRVALCPSLEKYGCELEEGHAGDHSALNGDARWPNMAEGDGQREDNPSADALDRLWADIILARKPDYGDWEYPGQAYRHILAEFNDLNQRYEWRPIDSAPKDGSAILLWKGTEAYTVRWVQSEVMGPVWATPDGHVIFRATHWMPLPAPPPIHADQP